jgi:regulator of protease activity HflC (stomatin/prohibitin superfamily)
MEKQNKGIASLVIRILIIILGITLITSSFGTINAGERGVKTRFNKVVSTKQPGLYFKLPLGIEKVHKMDVKTRTINYDNEVSQQLSGASKDLQDVKIGVVLNYHIDPENVVEIFTQYNSVDNYAQNVLEPIVRETVKSISAEYTAEELVTKRNEFSDKVNSTLLEKFTSKNAIMEKFNITNFEFSKSFSDAIETKVTAVQKAEAARNTLEQVKAEAQQTIEKAKAEAEAIKIQAGAINSQGGADYVELKKIEKWNGVLPIYMLGESGTLLNIK